jgi:integrase
MLERDVDDDAIALQHVEANMTIGEPKATTISSERLLHNWGLYLCNAHHGLSVRTRNLRLTAIHSFFRYAALEAPAHSAQIQRVLAIPSKRFTRNLVNFLTRPEVDALLAAPDQRTWSGRRDHAFILVAVQTALRLSEMTGLKREDLILGTGAHVRVIGKGRKERCTPIARYTLAVLKGWLREPQRGNGDVLFPAPEVNG